MNHRAALTSLLTAARRAPKAFTLGERKKLINLDTEAFHAPSVLLEEGVNIFLQACWKKHMDKPYPGENGDGKQEVV